MASSPKWPQFSTARYLRLRARLLAGGPACYWGCGRRATEADHVPPLAECGYWHWNVVPACKACNSGRKGRTPTPVVNRSSRDW